MPDSGDIRQVPAPGTGAKACEWGPMIIRPASLTVRLSKPEGFTARTQARIGCSPNDLHHSSDSHPKIPHAPQSPARRCSISVHFPRAGLSLGAEVFSRFHKRLVPENPAACHRAVCEITNPAARHFSEWDFSILIAFTFRLLVRNGFTQAGRDRLRRHSVLHNQLRAPTVVRKWWREVASGVRPRVALADCSMASRGHLSQGGSVDVRF